MADPTDMGVPSPEARGSAAPRDRDPLDIAEEAGRACARAGGSQLDNPYKDGGFKAHIWNVGFCNEAFGTVIFDD